MQYLSIDRIEGEIAVCEDDSRRRVELPLSSLPPGARPGDVLAVDGSGCTLDREETERRRTAAAALQKKLFHRK